MPAGRVVSQRCCPIRERDFPSHRSLKRKRGVGEHPELPRLGCLPRLRPLCPPIALPSNPSLALQASSGFASMGDLEVREFPMKFQLSFTPRTPGPIRERNFRLLGICASLRGEELSGSLLGTWPHFASSSSRSRLGRRGKLIQNHSPERRTHKARRESSSDSGRASIRALSRTASAGPCMAVEVAT